MLPISADQNIGRLSILLEKGELAVKSTCIILKDAQMYFSHVICPRGHCCMMTLSATGLHGSIDKR